MISSARMQQFGFCILYLFLSLLPATAETFSHNAGVFLTSPQVTGILLTLGILFLVMSVVTLGTGVAEVCCFLTFSLLFGGRFLTGEDVWVPLAFFAAGVVFALVEVFVIPGFGVFGVLSLVSFAGLSVLLMESPQAGLAIFSMSIVLTVFCGILLMKYLPKFVITRKLFVLEPPVSQSKPVVPVAPPVSVGDRGEAASTLRPVGTALFGGRRVEVISEGEFLKKGQAVEVVRVEAQKVVVKSCS